MTKTVDLTKVNLSPKAIMWTAVAFSVVLVCYSAGQFGASKLKDILKGATSAAAESAEEF